MKIPAIDNLMRAARSYHRQHPLQFEDGVHIVHDYSEVKANEMTHWDIARFIVNDYRVSLIWEHPRYVYYGQIQAVAAQRMVGISPFRDSPRRSNRIRRGSRRAWIRSGGLYEFSSPTTPEYFDQMREAQRAVGDEVPFTVSPSMSIKRYRHGKDLYLCAPFEVRNQDDLKRLVAIARRLALRRSTLAEEFGEFSYTQADWLRERTIVDALKATDSGFSDP